MKKLITVILFLSFSKLYAQYIVSGIVIDDSSKEPLIAVQITTNTSIDTIYTDINGKYSIGVKDSSTLIYFKYVGYNDRVLKAKGEVLNVSFTKRDSFLIERIYTIENQSKYAYAQSMIQQLNGLNEKLLDSTNSLDDEYLFRVLCLPSFYQPISYTIIKRKNKYYVTYKIGKGAGGYPPKGIKRQGKVRISENNWKSFKRIIAYDSIDKVPIKTYQLMVDGTTWFYEKKTTTDYKYFRTNIPNENEIFAFAYLTELCNLNINKRYYDIENCYFDKRDEIIDLDTIETLIINQLIDNNIITKTDKPNTWDVEFSVKINSKGKIVKVDTWIENVKNRDIKKLLNKIDFSYLNLKKSIKFDFYCKNRSN